MSTEQLISPPLEASADERVAPPSVVVRPQFVTSELQSFRTAALRNHRLHFFRVAGRIATLVVADLIVLAVTVALVQRYLAPFVIAYVGSVPASLIGGLASVVAALLLGLMFSGCYGMADHWRSEWRLLRGILLGILFISWYELPRGLPIGAITYVASSAVALTVVLAAVRRGIAWCKQRWMVPLKAGVASTILGREEDCIRALARRDTLEDSGIDVVDVINIESTTQAELVRALHDSGCEAALLVGDYSHLVFRDVMRSVIAAECQLLTVPHGEQLGTMQPRLVWRSGQPFIEWRAPALRLPQLAAKRTLDLLVATTLLVLCAPLLLIISMWVGVESGAPVLFRQRRLGLHGFPFLCLKFRSMYRDAEARLRAEPGLWNEYVRNDFKLPAERDSRITQAGRFLRRTSLDELPQLWNVLRGDMSLVGPRPIVPEELTHYTDDARLFLSLKPGITGAWQVGGRSSLAYPQRAAVELDYIENWSLTKDLTILLRTLPSVLAARGAH